MADSTVATDTPPDSHQGKDEEARSHSGPDEGRHHHSQSAAPASRVPGKVDLDSKFHWGRLLGRGSYADVVLVHTLPPPDHPAGEPFSPTPYAMKIIDKRLIKSNHQLQELLREIRIMRRVSHHNIVRLCEVFETERKVYLQMEYVSGGELFDRIAEREHFSEREARDIVYQIVDALSYLHSMGVVHRDLKPENILTLPPQEHPPSPVPASIVHDLSKPTIISNAATQPAPPLLPLPYPHPASLTIKLADFGLATTLGFPPSSFLHPLKTQCGSFPYVAPEILVGSDQRGYGYEVDIWSLGVIAYVLLSGHFPFRPEAYSSKDPDGHVDGDPHAPRPESTRRMLDRIMEGGWKKAMTGESWDGVSKEGKEWVQRCLETDPGRRWDAEAAKSAAWFRTRLEGDETISGDQEPSMQFEDTKSAENGRWSRVFDKMGEALSGNKTGPEELSTSTPSPSIGSESRRGGPMDLKEGPSLDGETASISHADNNHTQRQTTSQKIGEWWNHFVHGDWSTEAATGPPDSDTEQEQQQVVETAPGSEDGRLPPLSVKTRKPTSQDLHSPKPGSSWNPKHLVHRIRVHAWERRKLKEERMKDVDTV